MPIYEYECGHCQGRFEKRQGFHEEPEATCPECNEKARRVFQPSPIIFKGSGFYITDSRKSKPMELTEGKKETKGKEEAKKETKGKEEAKKGS